MSNFETVVFDVDGVLVRGPEACPNAKTTLERLSDEGIRIVLATNNSTRTPENIALRIAETVGFEPDPSLVVTSGLSTARHLGPEGLTAYVVGGPDLPTVLEREGVATTDDWRQADVVVVGLDAAITYEKLTHATYAIRAGARFVATNHDPTFPTPIGQAPGAGAIVAAVERSSAVTPEVFGKPFAAFGSVVGAMTTGRVAMVGDRIDSDMALARNMGWHAILLLTGVSTAEEAATADVDVVLDGIGDVPAAIGLV